MLYGKPLSQKKKEGNNREVWNERKYMHSQKGMSDVILPNITNINTTYM